MKVSIKLTDEEVRDAIEEKVFSLFPDEALVGDTETKIRLYAYGPDEGFGATFIDLSNLEWDLEVRAKVKSLAN